MKKRPDENEYQYIWRLGQAKDSGVLDMNWPQLAEVLNQELREDQPFQESAYRKPYQSASLYYQNVFSKMKSDNDYSKQLQAQKDELYILKKQYQDQRREYNKSLDVDARWGNLADRIEAAARDVAYLKPLVISKTNPVTGDKEAILVFNDWHFGLVTNNIFNTYNIEICKSRVASLVSRVKRHLSLHQVKTLHVLLIGDAAHGAIHVGVRVASEEETCDQIMHVSEVFAEAINEISSEVESVNVHSSYGNHLRTIQNKKESSHSDNMEKLIPWWLRWRLSANEKVKIVDSDYYEFIRLNVCGFSVCGVHGDLDSVKALGVTANTIFSQKYGEVIHYAIMGDKHHLEEHDSFGIETILCPSLCGTDDHANSLRLYSNPAQTLMIFSKEEGRECTYNIKV